MLDLTPCVMSKKGLRYPIPPYGAQMDPAAGLGVSYPG